jgi:dolichyl-phosphate beta-glucosyltransferase
MKYSIVIPAYNEEDKITSTLTQVVNFMRNFTDSFEVLIVNDGSADKTASKVLDYSKDNSEVTLIDNPHKGKGFAVWTGMLKAQGELIYMADADLSAPIEDLKKFSVWSLEQGFDVVIGSREGFGAKRVGEPWYRHVMGRAFNLFVQVVAVPGISDSQCGFKLFTKKSAKDIFSRMQVYGADTKEIKSTFFGAWDVEVLFLARRLGYKIKQIPVTWVYVKSKKFNIIANSVKMARDVLKIRINDIRGRYKTAHPTSNLPEA